jgi:hypothetical protein
MVEECKQGCVNIPEFAAPVGTRMDGACSAKRYDSGSLNCIWLYIDEGKVTKASCFEE